MNPAVPSATLAKLSISGQGGESSSSQSPNPRPEKGKARAHQSTGGKNQTPKPNPSRGGTRLRGFDRDLPEVRISKTLSWLLRHGAQAERLPIRKDGYVKVVDLIEHPKLKAQDINLKKIKEVVEADSKQRYDLILESTQGVKLLVWGAEPASTSTTRESEATPASHGVESEKDGVWLIKARQGHSIKTVEVELKSINSVSDIPSGIAVHGTNRIAWDMISKEGLSKMKRNHIHLAQSVAGQNVVSGMRTSSQILVFVDIQKALNAGIKFALSDNGVVLTEGDERGYLLKKFFSKVVDVRDGELKGWEET